MQTVQQQTTQAILRQHMEVSPVDDIQTPVEMNRDVDSDTYCTICNVVIGIVEKQITKNATEVMILVSFRDIGDMSIILIPTQALPFEICRRAFNSSPGKV